MKPPAHSWWAPRQHARAMDHVEANDAAHMDGEYPGPWMAIRMEPWSHTLHRLSTSRFYNVEGFLLADPHWWGEMAMLRRYVSEGRVEVF